MPESSYHSNFSTTVGPRILHNKNHPKRVYYFIRLVILGIFLIETKQNYIINQLISILSIRGMCSHTLRHPRQIPIDFHGGLPEQTNNRAPLKCTCTCQCKEPCTYFLRQQEPNESNECHFI